MLATENHRRVVIHITRTGLLCYSFSSFDESETEIYRRVICFDIRFLLLKSVTILSAVDTCMSVNTTWLLENTEQTIYSLLSNLTR